jgi:hypothetical protein
MEVGRYSPSTYNMRQDSFTGLQEEMAQMIRGKPIEPY